MTTIIGNATQQDLYPDQWAADLDAWGDACEYAQEAWAERSNAYALAGTDDRPALRYPTRPVDLLAWNNHTRRYARSGWLVWPVRATRPPWARDDADRWTIGDGLGHRNRIPF